MELAYRLAVERIAADPPDPRARHRQPSRRRPTPTAAIATSTGTASTWSDITERAGPHRGAAVLGQVHLPRQQPRHQLLAGHDAGAPRVVPAVASAGDARPARVGAVPLHVQRPGATEPDPRSDPLRRAADVRQLRDDAADQVRHARRVDARLRRHVVAGLPGLHVVEPQRPDPDVRDVRQRRRDDDEAHGDRADGAAAPALPRRTRPRASGIGRCLPTRKSTWSMRNNTNYMQTGVLIRAAATPRRSPRSCSRTSTSRAATPSRPGRRRRRTVRHSRRPEGSRPASPCS